MTRLASPEVCGAGLLPRLAGLALQIQRHLRPRVMPIVCDSTGMVYPAFTAKLRYLSHRRTALRRTLGGALKPNDFATASRSRRCTLNMLFS